MGTFNLMPTCYLGIASVILGAASYMIPFGYGRLPINGIMEVRLLKEGESRPCAEVVVEVDYDRESRSVTHRVGGRMIQGHEVLIDWIRRLRNPTVTITIDAAPSVPWENIENLLRELDRHGYRRVLLLPLPGH